MSRLRRTWRIARKSWRVLAADPWLVAVSAGAGVASFLVFLAVYLAGAAMVGREAFAQEGPQGMMWVVYGLGGLVSTWVSKVGQGVVVASAAQRMEGGDPTPRSAFTAVRGRLWQILSWAALTTVVGMILEQLRRIRLAGPLLSALGNLAFTVVSFLALPVIMLEGAGAWDALKRSAALLKGTWGENVAFNFSLGVLGFLAVLPALVVGGLALATGVAAVVVVALVAAAVWFILAAGILSALSAVYKTALYRWATGLSVDSVFDADELEHAFRPSPTRSRT